MVMFFWLKVPFVRATIFLIAGILLFLTNLVTPLFMGIITILSIVFLIVVHLKAGANLLTRNILVASATMFLITGVGYFLALHETAVRDKTNLIHFTGVSAYQGSITSDLQETGSIIELRFQ
jgi:membrane-bound ClpP family serine protease